MEARSLSVRKKLEQIGRAYDDFLDYYKNDSKLYKIQANLAAWVVYAGSILAGLVVGLDEAILVVLLVCLVNIGFPFVYYCTSYRKPIRIHKLETWNYRYPSREHDSRPTIRSIRTVVRVMVRFRPTPDNWKIRILTPTNVEVKPHKGQWTKDWVVSSQDSKNFLISCSNGKTYPHFSLNVIMRYIGRHISRSCRVKYFCETDAVPKQQLILDKLVWFLP